MTDGQVEAFGKVNLCLFLGSPRADGRHELVTLFESVGLVDRLALTQLAAGPDEVICPGVSGPNLVTEALGALRAAGWSAPPVRVEIEKRIPVAAGMGGGSADAAAILRYAPRLGRVATGTLEAIAARLGADVPSQLDPGPSLGTAAGEVVAPVPRLPEHSFLVLPQSFFLPTAEVYREADRLGLSRARPELDSRRAELLSAITDAEHPVRPFPARLVINDLQAAAVSLAPEISAALEAARGAGAAQALVCGSGPTVIGVFWGADGFARARAGSESLRDRFPDAAAVQVIVRSPPSVPG